MRSQATAEELISKFEMDLKSATQKSSAKYFVMSVESVKASTSTRDQFLVTGVRFDTGQRVAVATQKSEGGQYLPEVGGVMRADKVTQLQSADMSIIRYSAQFFHAYGQNDRCMHAVIQCRPPYQDGGGMWNANVQILDHEGPSVHIKSVEEFDRFMLALLRPWKWKNPGKCTHDVSGNPLWDQDGARGISPMVHIKMMGGEKVLTQIYGKACVTLPNGQTRLANVEESKAAMLNSKTFQKVREMFDHDSVQTLGLVLIPGVSVGVGRASISHGQERYLRNPDGWDWRHEVPADNGESKPSVTRGYRSGMVHLKKSDKGAWVVVDANPSNVNRLSPWGPKSIVEAEFERQSPMFKQAEAQEQSLHRASQPARKADSVHHEAPAMKSVSAPAVGVEHAESSELDPDLIHSPSQSIKSEGVGSTTDELDRLFADAESKAHERRSIHKFRM